jgi:hypothetical protein
MEPLAKDLIYDDEHAMATINDLKKQLEAVKSKNLHLEDECDLLAMENDRLRTLCQTNGINPDFVAAEKETSYFPTADAVPVANIEDEDEFLVNAGGDERYARSPGREISDACGSGNALCVEYLLLPPGPSSSDTTTDNSAVTAATQQEQEQEMYILCGGVDKVLRLYALSSGALLYSLPLAAPILAIDSSGPLVACSMMDGSHAVVSE